MTEYKTYLQTRISSARKSADTGARAWSCAYHVALGAAAIFGAVAVGLAAAKDLQLEYIDESTLIALLSLSAAALTATATIGGFERKWVRNRTTRLELDNLIDDCHAPDVVDKVIAENFRGIMTRHNGAIIPPSDVPPKPKP